MSRPEPRILSGVLVALLAGLPCCETLDGGARQSFASLASCPADEATVVPRPEYRIPLPPDTPPPEEVAADPARLADWQHRREAAKLLNEQTPCGAALPSFDAYEVTGCGQDVILCRARPPTPGGRPVSAGEGSCVQQPMAGGSPPLRGRGPQASPPPPPPPSATAAPTAAPDTSSHAL